jgi:hypothetical protein
MITYPEFIVDGGNLDVSKFLRLVRLPRGYPEKLSGPLISLRIRGQQRIARKHITQTRKLGVLMPCQ